MAEKKDQGLTMQHVIEDHETGKLLRIFSFDRDGAKRHTIIEIKDGRRKIYFPCGSAVQRWLVEHMSALINSEYSISAMKKRTTDD